ncbi:MAG: 4Fe-4S binding protein [Gammaproteobacteria bacterium]|nr:4Fe-4S binding protein [Gammaproteobacteria bacterium]
MHAVAHAEDWTDEGDGATVEYRCRGSLLLCGPPEAVRPLLSRLPAGLRTVAVAPGLGGLGRPPALKTLGARVSRIEGHLGRFRAYGQGSDGELDLGPLSTNRDGLFDLVMDLGDPPLDPREVPPLGYVRSAGSLAEAVERLEQLARLEGTVHKPRYFDFDAGLCAHTRQGRTGCRRCLDACAAGAIDSPGGRITIDPYLCQGCGGCALVCPTGAVSHRRSAAAPTLAAIARALDTAPVHPTLVIHADAHPPTAAAGDMVSLPTAAVAAIGADTWLGSLALGAARVVVMTPADLPLSSRQALATEVAAARCLLEGIGCDPNTIHLQNKDDDTPPVSAGATVTPRPSLDVSTLSSAGGKRDRLLVALGHLAHHAPTPARSVGLPAGAPYGRLGMAVERCTLCLACTVLCPTRALGAEQGALVLDDGACIQCGLCSDACPEQALSLLADFDGRCLASGAAGRRTLKAASEPYPCAACGRPFASRALVMRGMEHVRDHPMFQGKGRQLLEMCPECRQAAATGLAGSPR